MKSRCKVWLRYKHWSLLLKELTLVHSASDSFLKLSICPGIRCAARIRPLIYLTPPIPPPANFSAEWLIGGA